MIPDPAANNPPVKRLHYSEVSFTAQDLMLEYNMTIEQARAFLTRYEQWIFEAMRDAGDAIVRQITYAESIEKYDDM